MSIERKALYDAAKQASAERMKKLGIGINTETTKGTDKLRKAALSAYKSRLEALKTQARG